MDHYFSEVLKGKDHSESTKILLAEVIKNKTSNTANVIELMKAKVKLETAKLKPTNNGVVVVAKPGSEYGINLENLQ